MTVTVIFWDFSLVDSDPLDCLIVQMKIPLSSLCIDLTSRLPFTNWMNLLFGKVRPSSLFHVNWGEGFPRALQRIMPGIPILNCCSGVSSLNLAKEVKWINTNPCHLWSNCDIFWVFSLPCKLRRRISQGATVYNAGHPNSELLSWSFVFEFS